MRQIGPTLALALWVTGCLAPQPSVNFGGDLIDNTNCVPEKVITGLLTESLTVQTDEGEIRGLIWPASYTLRWAPAWLTGHFEVLDGTGTVVATTGRRYIFSGSDFIAAGNAFWVCGGMTPL